MKSESTPVPAPSRDHARPSLPVERNSVPRVSFTWVKGRTGYRVQADGAEKWTVLIKAPWGPVAAETMGTSRLLAWLTDHPTAPPDLTRAVRQP